MVLTIQPYQPAIEPTATCARQQLTMLHRSHRNVNYTVWAPEATFPIVCAQKIMAVAIAHIPEGLAVAMDRAITATIL